MQSQLLRVLASHPVQVTVDCSNRSWRASLQAVGMCILYMHVYARMCVR